MRKQGLLTTATGRQVSVMHDVTVDAQGMARGSIKSPDLTQADVTCGPNDRLYLQLADGPRVVLVCHTTHVMEGRHTVSGHLDQDAGANRSHE